MIALDTLDRQTAERALAEYAEKAVDAARDYDIEKARRGRSEVARGHALDVQVYAAAATALAAALETGAIR